MLNNLHNLEDMKKIIRDIADEPDKVRNGLADTQRDNFNKAFPAMEIKLAEE